MPLITPAHLHILINHLPIMGFPFITLLLIWGLIRKHDQVVRAALLGAIVVGVGTWVADITGDEAKDEIRDLAWVQRDLIKTHEAAADWANGFGIATAVLALGTLVMARGGRPVHRGAVYGVLVLLIFGAATSAKTGWDGGKIRHDEFAVPTSP